jgi:phospholipase C
MIRWCCFSLVSLALVSCAHSQVVPPGPSFASNLTEQSNAIPQKINHVVIIVQENRTPDNLFQGLPGADIRDWGLNSYGQRVSLRPVSFVAHYDLSHEHDAFVTEYDRGKMDGWNLEVSTKRCRAKTTCAYGYVPRSETKPYFQMAQEYAFADRMFQSNQGPSYPAHQYLVSGDSAALPISQNNVSSNPIKTAHGMGGGCDSRPSTRVYTIAPPIGSQEGNPLFPCFDRPTLSDLLDAKGLSWRYYQDHRADGLWNAFDSIRHVRYGQDYRNVVWPTTTILTDIANSDLANVAWVMPPTEDSDHAGPGASVNGPTWVAAIVNAIGRSRYWDQTAIIITWDDWGGWYDHVRPTIYNSYELGFRVPLIVISPYAKKAYVSHVHHEFGSILKFVEDRFDLGSLGTTDARSDDLKDCFDFLHQRREFVRIKAPQFHPSPSDGLGEEDP